MWNSIMEALLRLQGRGHPPMKSWLRCMPYFIPAATAGWLLSWATSASFPALMVALFGMQVVFDLIYRPLPPALSPDTPANTP